MLPGNGISHPRISNAVDILHDHAVAFIRSKAQPRNVPVVTPYHHKKQDGLARA
jgi:hypothetical protein